MCAFFGGEMMIDFGQEFHYTLGDPAKCGDEDARYWIPVVLGSYLPDDKYTWLKDVNGKKEINVEDQKWAKSQPNNYGSDQCVGLMEHSGGDYFWNDIGCTTPRCSVCSIPEAQTYYLRGTKSYDHQYLLSWHMQDGGSKLTFDGRGRNQIHWYPTETRYEISNVGNGHIEVSRKQNPFGHLESVWPQTIFTNVSSTIFIEPNLIVIVVVSCAYIISVQSRNSIHMFQRWQMCFTQSALQQEDRL